MARIVALLAALRQRLKRERPGQALHSVMAIEQYVDGRVAGLTANWQSLVGTGVGILALSMIAMGGPVLRALRIELREALRSDG